MIYNIKTAYQERNLNEFKKLVENKTSIPHEIENNIIVNKDRDFLEVLIENDLLSSEAKSLTSCFDRNNKLRYKLRNEV